MASVKKDDNMDTNESAGPSEPKKPRMVIVNPDKITEEIGSGKKPKIELNEKQKHLVLKSIIMAYTKILMHLNLWKRESLKDITMSCSITSIIFTCYNVLRQKFNQTGGKVEEKTKVTDFTITMSTGTATLLTEDGIKIVKEAFEENNLIFKKYDAKDVENWYGTAAPYLSFFAAFSLRLREVRLGNTHMPVTKKGGDTYAIEVSEYGLTRTHHVLLEGSTYPPEKRSAMAQTVGPMTAIICYLRAHKEYEGKWYEAALRACKHIPDIGSILKTLKSTDTIQCRVPMKILADILIMATARNAQRIFVPLCFLVDACMSMDKDNQYKLYESLSYKTKDEATIEFGIKHLPKLNFSGVGAFCLYKISAKTEWRIRGEMTSEKAKQIVFHAIFGSHKEDLSVLGQITEQKNWMNREELGDAFLKMGSSTKHVDFKLPQLKVYSKMASANQTGILSSKAQQLASLPIMSGKRSRQLSDAFFESLQEDGQESQSNRSLKGIISNLAAAREEARVYYEKNSNVIQTGTTSWHDMGSITLEKHGNELPDFTVKEECKYFL